MPRMPRAVLPDIAHHLTQRGVDCQDVFFTDLDREVYLNLAARAMRQHGVRILAYCLMTNHVHWVVAPETANALARAFGWLHGRYAQYLNAGRVRNGHLWQNRFFSCALDEAHTWAAIRYVERNPVRAGIVQTAELWGWSSARTRLRLGTRVPMLLDLVAWHERFTVDEWREMLLAESLSEAEGRLRSNTYTGRPLGSESFVGQAEQALKRKLKASKGGRPKRQEASRAATLFAGGAV